MTCTKTPRLRSACRLIVALGIGPASVATAMAKQPAPATPVGETETSTASEREPSPRSAVVFLMPLTTLGTDDETASIIQRVLTTELRTLLGGRLDTYAALSGRSVETIERLEACGGAVECLAAEGRLLGWESFVVGNVSGLGEQRVIKLKLVDALKGEAIRQVSESLSADEGRLTDMLRLAAVSLVAPEKATGALVLVTEQQGVQIFVDGELYGVTPLAEPSVTVSIGTHEIEARGIGFVPFNAITDVGYGESKEVSITLGRSALELVTEDFRFREQWWTWAIAGAGAVALGVAAGFNVAHASTAGDIRSLARDGTLSAQNVGLYDQQAAEWDQAVGFYVSGGVLIGVSGVLFLLDLL